MEYCAPAVERQAGSASFSQSQDVATRRAQRVANKAKRTEEAEELRLKGNESFRKGHYANAAECYFQAAMIRGPEPILMSNLAAAYLKLEAYNEAEWAATVALEYDPQYLKARHRRGLARKETFAFKAASKDFETILCLDPQCQAAKEELALVRTALQSGEGREVSEDEDYPRYSDTPWAYYSDSDTPDCNHVGVRRIPCRHYNRGKCNRGTTCDFSHAPDDKSVRDELGRNVCTHYLLDSCIYGAKACVYSHDRSHLPPNGWWNYPEQVAAGKRVQALINDSCMVDYYAPIVHEHPKAKNIFAKAKRLDIFEQLDSRHRDAVSDTEEPQPMTLPTERFVLLICLEDVSFDLICQHFLATLNDKIKVVRAFKVYQALQCLDSPHLVAVYATDAGVTKSKRRALVNRLVAYTKNGGTFVAGGQFSSFVNQKDFNAFTKAWGLAWEYGDYYRTTFSPNPSHEVVKRNPSLLAAYSMKTLHASNILPEHAVYKHAQDSRLESLVFPPVKVEDKGESPVVQAKVGQGRFGFIGDVNGEVGSTNTVLALLGILDQPVGSLSTSVQCGAPQDATTAIPPTKKARKAKTKKAEETFEAGSFLDVSIQRQDGAERQSKNSAFPTESPLTGRRCIIVFLLDSPDLFKDMCGDQLSKLQQHAEVKFSHSVLQLQAHLSSKNLAGIYIADAGIIQSENAQALQIVVEYVTKNAGQVVIGGLFPSTAPLLDFPILLKAFGLPWKAAAYSSDQAALNSKHSLCAPYGQSLPVCFTVNAVSLNSFDQEDVLYFRNSYGYGKTEAPVLQTKVGQGQLGYIGDVNSEEGTQNILLAMLGLLPSKNQLHPPDKQRFVIMLSWMTFVSAGGKAFVDDLNSRKIEIIHGLSNARIVELLHSCDLAGVLVTDAGICDSGNAYLLSKLVEYTSSGGTVVFGGLFAATMVGERVEPFFRDNWGFEWKFSNDVDARVTRNAQNNLVQRLDDSKLPSNFHAHGVYLEGITEEMAVYSTLEIPSVWSPKDKIFKSTFVFAQVNGTNGRAGHVGFVGDMRLNSDVRNILCALLGLF